MRMKIVYILFAFQFVFAMKSHSQNAYSLYEKIAAKRMTNLLFQSDYALQGNKMVLVDTLVYVFNNDYKITSMKDGMSTGFPIKEFFYNDEKKLSKIQHNAKGYNGLHLFRITPELKLELVDLFRTSLEATPIVYNGRIYVGSRDGYLYCFGD